MNGDALRSSLKCVYYFTNVPKLSGDVILGNNGSAAGTALSKLQDKTEYRLIKTALISSASHFDLGLKLCFDPPERRD